MHINIIDLSMICTKITFFLLLSVFSTFGQEVGQFKVGQPLLKNLFVWDNLLIAEKDWTTKDKYYICDTLKGKLTKLKIANDTNILDLAETQSFLYAITVRDSSYILLTKNKRQDSWSSETLFLRFQEFPEFKLVANDNILVLLTSEKIYTKKGKSEWQEILLDSLIDLDWLMMRGIPEHCLLTKHFLYLGFDRGEWGGALWEIPIFTNNGMAHCKKGILILEDNIRAIEYSSEGILWIATGLSHLGLRESGVYRYKDSKLIKVLWSAPALSLKGQSELSAFCLNKNREPIFIASEYGVFKIVDKNLKEVLNTKLCIMYNKKDDTIISSPVAMHIDKNNNIYIAQRSMGIFVYTKTRDTYSFRQITFD